MSLLLGIDIGTQSVKSVVVSEQGKLLATASAELTLESPQQGWMEQNPGDWVKAAIKSITQLPKKLRKQIGAISFSGQMHGLTLLDHHNQPLMNAILWCDTRTTDSCQKIKDVVGLDRLLSTTMNPPLEGFTLPKLVWIHDHQKAILDQAQTLLLPKDYVRFCFTGEKNLELSDGAGTLMQDIAKGCWDIDLVQSLNLNHHLLPPLIKSTDQVGYLLTDLAKQCGLPHKIPVYAGGADNACAAISSGVIKSGTVSFSIGTSGTVVAPTASPRIDPGGRVHTFNHAVDQLFYVMGVHQSSGLSLRWWRDMTQTENYDDLVQAAQDIGDGSDGLLFAPWLNGERTPFMNGQLRGSFIGLSSSHTQAHLTRAILEGVALSFRHSVELMKNMGIPFDHCRLLGGGARSTLWTQIMANTLNLPLSRLEVEEGPAYGAALIAGVGHGVFSHFDEACSSIKIKDTINPQLESIEQMNHVFDRYNKIHQAVCAI